MAENSLSCLEYWLNNIPLDNLKPFYSVIFNKFDDYLQMNKVSHRNTDEALVKEKTLLLKLTYKGKGRKRLPIKLFQKNTSVENSDIYEKIQFRILKILGKLSGDMNHCLYDANQYNQIISLDTVDHLKFSIPFIDMKPAIYFDRFLPRVIYLSLSSTNRQTKLNACELLHAIVVYMIGNQKNI